MSFLFETLVKKIKNDLNPLLLAKLHNLLALRMKCDPCTVIPGLYLQNSVFVPKFGL